jgi:hypothetical protein
MNTDESYELGRQSAESDYRDNVTRVTYYHSAEYRKGYYETLGKLSKPANFEFI